MTIIAFISQKGGVGKSTLLQQLTIDAPARTSQGTLEIAKKADSIVQPVGASNDDLIPALIHLHSNKRISPRSTFSTFPATHYLRIKQVQSHFRIPTKQTPIIKYSNFLNLGGYFAIISMASFISFFSKSNFSIGNKSF
ncbi:unnamed protein product [Rhizophagus irregularis]|nr:unnamed protein product [Rhizophagus irregularis]